MGGRAPPGRKNMNDFFLETNRSIKINDIEVRQIQMKDFDTWAIPAEPLKNFIKDQNHSNEILRGLFKAHSVQVISTMACVTDLNNESLVEFAADKQGFKELLSEVMKMNYGTFQNYVIA